MQINLFQLFLFWTMSKEKNSVKVNYTPVIYQILKQSIVAIIIFLIRTILFFCLLLVSALHYCTKKQNSHRSHTNNKWFTRYDFMISGCEFLIFCLMKALSICGPLQPGNQITCSETEAPLKLCSWYIVAAWTAASMVHLVVTCSENIILINTRIMSLLNEI